MPLSISSRLTLAILGALLCCGGCSSTGGSSGGRNQISYLVRYGRTEEARKLAVELLERSPDDPRALRNVVDTEVACLLERGIEQLLLDRVEGGLRYFYRAQELDPNNEVVALWVRKANVQIAEDCMTLAAGISERKEPEAKVAALQRVLAHLPADSNTERVQALRAKAIRGLISVQMFQGYLLGGTYTTYQDGLRDLNRSVVAQGLGEELRSGIANTLEAQVSGVDRRFIQASQYEAEGLLLAARFEFEMVLSLHPEHPGASAGVARLAPLLRGMELTGLPRLGIERAQAIDDALESIPAELTGGKGLDFLVSVNDPLPESPSQERPQLELQELPASRAEAPKPQPGSLEPMSKESKLAELYAAAQDLEVLGLLPAAVEIYDQILRLAPKYKDAAERRDTHAELIIHAENLYTSAMDADSDSTALALLKRIVVFWPNYRDVAEQIKARERTQPEREDSEHYL